MTTESTQEIGERLAKEMGLGIMRSGGPFACTWNGLVEGPLPSDLRI